jgi:hypothetical protein
MDECCCAGAQDDVDSATCTRCHTTGKPVDELTVKALLIGSALARFDPGAYRFCPDADCDIVYFAEHGGTFSKSDLRVTVWQKEPMGSRMLCYCFGETDTTIAGEIAGTGASHAAERIRAHIKAGRCACAVRNPRGVCCLGDVNVAVERMLQGHTTKSKQ